VAKADIGLKLELQHAKFSQMLADLGAIDPAVEFRDVVRAEAGAVAAGAMGRTKSARVNKILAYYASRKFITMDGKVYRIDYNRYPDALWERMLDMSKQAREIALDARGISKQSWYHAAQSFGKPMKAPAYVLAANYKGQQYPQDGSSSEVGGGDQFALTMVNSSPVVQKANGQWALLGAMTARTRYFERNMAHAFFLNAKTRAAKYPGIFTDPVPPAASSPTEIPSGT
jgi:hypothetical protein